jgi:hypothetical protein
MLGLNNSHIASRPIDTLTTRWQHFSGHRKGDGCYVLRRRPDIVVLGPSHGFLGTDPTLWFLGDYELLHAPLFLHAYRPYFLRTGDCIPRCILDQFPDVELGETVGATGPRVPLVLYVRTGTQAEQAIAVGATALDAPPLPSRDTIDCLPCLAPVQSP